MMVQERRIGDRRRPGPCRGCHVPFSATAVACVRVAGRRGAGWLPLIGKRAHSFWAAVSRACPGRVWRLDLPSLARPWLPDGVAPVPPWEEVAARA